MEISAHFIQRASIGALLWYHIMISEQPEMRWKHFRTNHWSVGSLTYISPFQRYTLLLYSSSFPQFPFVQNNSRDHCLVVHQDYLPRHRGSISNTTAKRVFILGKIMKIQRINEYLCPHITLFKWSILIAQFTL